MWRPAEDGAGRAVRPVIVTVSYNEAARMLDGGEQVDAVPMPPEILAWMQPFVAEHYKPEPRGRCGATTRSRDDASAAAASARADRVVACCATADERRRTSAPPASRCGAGRSASSRRRARRPRRQRLRAATPAPPADAGASRRRPPGRPAASGAPTAVAVPAARPAHCRRRVAHLRLRFHGVPAAEGRRGAEAAGAEAAVPRSAVQRDGRPRRLHRRLLEARSDLAGASCASWSRAATSSIRRRRA